MKQIPLLQGKALLVEMPEGAQGWGITKDNDLGWYIPIWDNQAQDWDWDGSVIDLPPGNWRIIGMLSEVTEEMATTVVKECIDACECTTGYVNYNRGNKPKPFCLDTAIESLESAIEAVGYYLDNNPIPPFHERKDDWMMAQERILARSRCLLLGREI